MLQRHVEHKLSALTAGYPVITITGPRQSGKTTLARSFFSSKPYLSLENPDIREEAINDPRSLLSRYSDGAIFDEVQRCPELLSYLTQIVDEGPKQCRFILTGSRQFGLKSKITQSLAGRTALIHLLPFSYPELYSHPDSLPQLEQVLFTGLYPPIHDRALDPRKWYADYVQTYIERDVRSLINIRDLAQFQLFLKMCAARCGHLINFSAMAADCGITHNTAREWISILEASYIVFRVTPYFNNFGKRLVKTPKLFFYDTGLVTYLLGITSPEHLNIHPNRGALFETFVTSELLKSAFNNGSIPSVYFWRDRSGNEIDGIIDKGTSLLPIEMKSGKTVASDWFTGLKKWTTMVTAQLDRETVVYGGDDSYLREGCRIVTWRDAYRLMETDRAGNSSE
jgi:predicted AAA+ superfamily ATPase